MKTRNALFVSILALVAGALVGSCAEGGSQSSDDEAAIAGAMTPGSEKIDVLLRVIVDRGITRDNATRAFPRRLVTVRHGRSGEPDEVYADVLIQAAHTAIPRLRALGATIRTVTDGGIMTASVPLSSVRAIAALDDVTRIEAAKRVHPSNDISNDIASTPAGYWYGMNNPYSIKGAGVVVGVIDTGIDWTHKDFIKDATENGPAPQTRVLSYWDQSDLADDKPPSDLGLNYGHEYTAGEINNALQNFDNSWNPDTNWFGPIDNAAYPIKASARDMDGHGTHVCGTSAGDGSGSGRMGAAPEADIIFVKFDFDGDRNTDAAIVDGVNYIFKRAAAAGKPAVINMSLGSDYGPHDGTTLEERGIDDLTGPGKVVVVAAGNPGASNWSPNLRWGFALHGSGALNTETFTFRFPQYTVSPTDNYMFFDLWYKAGNKCRVKVTTPHNVTYPPSGSQYKNTWVTGSPWATFNTPDGMVGVQNGGDPIGFASNSGDSEVYIEISDYYGKVPATGVWTFQLVKATATSTCSGTFHVWYGASDNVIAAWRSENPKSPTPLFAGRETDNKMTIGNPASANKVIAVAAYQSRVSWNYAYGTECLPESTGTQSYSVYPIHYYDPMQHGELAFFSGRGPRRDNVLKPEISTPGVGIASALSHFNRWEEWSGKCQDYWNGGFYHFGTNRVLPGVEATILQGTSMAAPNATGAIAVLLQQKKDLTDSCLRKVFSTTARHDPATDAYENAVGSAKTDTDTAAGAGKSNFDWGWGKLDIAATLAALAPYPTCPAPPASCSKNGDCAAGYTCSLPADQCGCGQCVAACLPAGSSCTANAQCCSKSCTGKTGKKTCK